MSALENFNFDVSEPTRLSDGLQSILSYVDEKSDYWTDNTPRAIAKQNGQVFTPSRMAFMLASLLPDRSIDGQIAHIADAGCGTGILSISMAARIAMIQQPPALRVTGYETDKRLVHDWNKSWARLEHYLNNPIHIELNEDFTNDAEHVLTTGTVPGVDSKPNVIVINPPYIKLAAKSPLARLLREHAVPVPNLYAAFTLLSLCWLQDGGALHCILPRSFCNGDYFAAFRRFLSENASIEHIVLYRSRHCFKHSLLEGILIRFTKTKSQSKRIRLSVADSPDTEPDVDLLLNSNEVLTEGAWLLPRSIEDIEHLNNNRKRKFTLNTKGIKVSTGKLELHRVSEGDYTRVLYSRDFDANGNITWNEKRKPRMLKAVERQIHILPEAGGFVAIKRISSNESAKATRLFPIALTKQSLGVDKIAVDNHLQVFSKQDGSPLSELELTQLINFLRTDEANAVIRTVSGSTQVNVSDLAQLRLP